jgi:hypothetical protein
MQRKLYILGLTCLLVFGFSFYYSDQSLAFDMGLERHNMTPYEIELIDNILDISSGQRHDSVVLQKNIELGKKQAEAAEQNFIEMAIRDTINGTIEEIPRSTLRSSWFLTGLNTYKSCGGHGLGTSDSYWASDLRNRNGSLVGINGYRWAKGWGTTSFTAPSTGNYSVTANYRITGNIWGGNLNVKIQFIDVNDNRTKEQNYLDLDYGYYDNVPQEQTRDFYLEGGHTYTVVFQVATEATASVGQEMADFLNTELDGTQRNVDFEWLEITN